MKNKDAANTQVVSQISNNKSEDTANISGSILISENEK
jgi:hypothetical protein